MLTQKQVFETVLRYATEAHQLGALADDLDDVANKSGAAEDKLLALGARVAKVVLPVAAVTTAVAGLGFALVRLTRDAAAATEDLRARGLLTEQDAKKIDKAAKAVDGVSVAFSSLKATVAGALAPLTDAVFTGITGVITGMNLVLKEGKISWDEWADAVARAKGMVSGEDDWLSRKARDFAATLPEGFASIRGSDAAEREARQLDADRAWLAEQIRLEEERKAAEWLKRQEALQTQQSRIAGFQLESEAGRRAGQAGNQGAEQQAALDALDALQQHKIALHEAELERVAELQEAQMEASRATQEQARRLAAEHAQGAAIARQAWTTAAIGIVSALGPLLAKSAAGQKAHAKIVAAANTGAAIMQAAASAPPPYNAAPIAAMALLGAVQVAAAGEGRLASPGAAGGASGGPEKPDHYRAETYTPSAQGVYGDPGRMRGVQISEDLTIVRDLQGWLERERRRMRLDRRGA